MESVQVLDETILVYRCRCYVIGEKREREREREGGDTFSKTTSSVFVEGFSL